MVTVLLWDWRGKVYCGRGVTRVPVAQGWGKRRRELAPWTTEGRARHGGTTDTRHDVDRESGLT